ncbi:hypothetical protein BC940DRAFT_243570 [Gongronella butleri]|nr:hypothetical protein BC940DRAFT_243570 [Gongronella butleri]
MFIISTSPGLNVFFTAGPLYLAVFTASLPAGDLGNVRVWAHRLSTDLLDADQSGGIRVHGLAKVFRGVFKLAFNQGVLDPFFLAAVKDDLTKILEIPFYHPQAMVYHLLLGIKAYCLLGVVDICLGTEQLLFGVRYIDLFQSPLLSSSPRDFWSRRWNMVMRNTFHSKVFSVKDEIVASDEKKMAAPAETKASFWSSANGRGLLVFLMSAILHEMIVCANSREITLENFVFFLLHGLVMMAEVNLTRRQRRSTASWSWALCVAINLVFMSFTARLFLAPFIRFDFLSPLPRTHALVFA